jgi:NAD(P)H dehydrogenase (quinone)
MRVLIVHTHHEPKSFNGAMTREAAAALSEAGHEVEISDLYAMGFDPVSDRRNFTTVGDPDYLKQQAEEAYAAAHDGFCADIQGEMDKLFWCDALILQFPLWWFGMPAILKGWVDRVFAAGGRIYGGGKWYDRGVFAGKRAMCAITIGGPATMYGEDGLNGPIQNILFPINHGILAFTGFSVVEPFLVFAPARLDEAARRARLAAYRERVLSLGNAKLIDYPRLADYDESYRLKAVTAAAQ